MPNQNEIHLVITVQDNGTPTVHRFGSSLQSLDSSVGSLKRSLQDYRVETERLDGKTASLTATIGGLLANIVSVTAVATVVKSGISYLGQIETATLAIGSAFMTGGEYIDQTSQKALSAEEALKAAQGDAKKIVEELQYANLQTIATLDELINAYQVTLPVALAKGFDRQQVKEFTVAMVQAAGAIGLQMNQLGEETRSLLTAAIDPRNSRIATVLGIRNEDIRQYKGNADELFRFLMEKLSAYRVAGIESQNTWAGLWSNAKDIVSQALGKRLEPLFDALKAELKSLADSIVVIDDKAQKIKWNPEFLEGINRFRDLLQESIAELYRLAMLLDKFGGSFSRMMHGLSFSELTGSTRWSKMNDEYRTRYMASEKSLQDMVMRGMGWKPVTPEMDKRMKEAAQQGKKIADQLQVNVGGEEPGTQQLLRYYRLKESGGPAGWQPKTPRPEQDKAAEKLAKEWKNTLRDLNADIAKEDLPDFEKKLIEIRKKAEELQEKFKSIPGAKEKITEWTTSRENDEVTEAAQKEFEEYLKGLETEKRILEEVEKKHQQARAARESAIKASLDELDIAEASGTYHRDTLDERIRLTEELIAIQEENLSQMDKMKDASAWYAQDAAIRSTKKSLLALKDELDPIRAKLRKYADDATNMGENIGNAYVKAFDSIADSLTELVATGKADFNSLAQSILKDLIKIEIRALLAAAAVSSIGSGSGGGSWIASAVSLVGSFFGGSSSGNSYTFADTGGDVDSGWSTTGYRNARGNIFGGGRIIPFAKGGTIVFNPTYFPMANGMGLMGEAGPEAVLPLKRLSNGNLGVQATGSQHTCIGISVPVSVTGSDTPERIWKSPAFRNEMETLVMGLVRKYANA
ncbi:MAG: phage tail tape measure protein [Syntrophaceae bacterium]|nr:phage tail tape measure protein [Syntrophaceae bacterium]